MSCHVGETDVYHVITQSYDCIKMNVVLSSIFVFLYFVAVSYGKEQVPVLFWSKNVDLPSVTSLSKIGAAHFSQLLHHVTESRPNLVLFLGDSISVEDFSLSSNDGEPAFPHLSESAKGGNIEFLPSVGNPIKAIRLLKDNGYRWLQYREDLQMDFTEPTILVVHLDSTTNDRQETLHAHDQLISQLYESLSNKYPELVAIYTGKKSSWVERNVETNRIRREAGDEEEGGDKFNGLVIRSGAVVILATNITYQASSDVAETQYKSVTEVELKNDTDTGSFVVLKATMDSGDVLSFNFSANPEAWSWALVSLSRNDELLTPLTPVGGPRGWSWYCHKTTTFTAGKKTAGYPRVVIEGIQLEPNVNLETFKFGQPIDCVPYFSSAIWSGILMIALLLSIMMWGLIMLMDINTNDRFDDPKGKTITISATD